MGLRDELSKVVATAREAGRDVPTVLEELFIFLADAIDPPKDEPAPQPQPPVSNDHVADGATQFTAEEIAASAPQPEQQQ